MPQNPVDDDAKLAPVMAWCRQATKHKQRQCWPRSMSPYGVTGPQNFNSSPPSVVYMRQWIGQHWFRYWTCRLDCAKPLSEVMLTYYQLAPKEQSSVKFYLKFKYFHSRKCVWTCRLPNWQPFCSGGVELRNQPRGNIMPRMKWLYSKMKSEIDIKCTRPTEIS